MMKKTIRHAAVIILIALAGAILGCGPSAAVSARRTVLPAPPPAPASALYTPGIPKPSVSAGRIRISDKYAEIDAVYPIVSGMTDKAFEAKFNASAEADIRNVADRLYADAEREYGEAGEKGFIYHPYTLESSLEPWLNDGMLLSIAVRMELYAGGAHPYPDSRFYALENSMPAKRLALPQLFADQAAGRARVERLIRDAIAASPGEYFDGPDTPVGDKTWFYLTDKELHIVFPAYSVAPGAAGEPDFGFPLALFKDELILGLP